MYVYTLTMAPAVTLKRASFSFSFGSSALLPSPPASSTSVMSRISWWLEGGTVNGEGGGGGRKGMSERGDGEGE